MPDLEIATTDELLEELLSRVDHGLVVLKRVMTDELQHDIRRWKGNSHTVAGMALHAQIAVLDELEESYEEEDEEDG